MQSLAITLLLGVLAAADGAERRSLAIAGLRARQPVPPGEATTDPCDFAREIASQPPCLASGDCESLQLWERAFGLPRFEPLDPARPAGLSLAVDRRRWERWRGAAPRTSRPVNPFAFCPAGDDPRR